MKKQLLVFSIVMSLQQPLVCTYQSILKHAIRANDSSEVERIINNQSYDHVLDKYKRNELHQAVTLNHVKILELLLQKEPSRALIENRDCYGLTSLEYAAKFGFIECAVLLISYDAQIILKKDAKKEAIENQNHDKISAIALQNGHELLRAAFRLIEEDEWDKQMFIDVMNCLKLTRKFIYPNQFSLECTFKPISNMSNHAEIIAAYQSLKLRVHGINFKGIY